jgi:hypothetical protein
MNDEQLNALADLYMGLNRRHQLNIKHNYQFRQLFEHPENLPWLLVYLHNQKLFIELPLRRFLKSPEQFWQDTESVTKQADYWEQRLRHKYAAMRGNRTIEPINNHNEPTARYKCNSRRLIHEQ